jgi:hypothetical protein
MSVRALKVQPAPPEYNNSAGRLIRMLEMFNPHDSIMGQIAKFYGLGSDEKLEVRSRCAYLFMSQLTEVYDQFLQELGASDKVPDATKEVVRQGLSRVTELIFPQSLSSAPRQLEDAEKSILRLAATFLDAESELAEDDKQKCRKSIEALQRIIESGDFPPTVRVGLLEVVRLSRNALEQYAIYGSRGFKSAFKKLLAELMELYLHEGDQKSWWGQVLEHVRLMDDIAGRLMKYKPLLEGYAPLLIASTSNKLTNLLGN